MEISNSEFTELGGQLVLPFFEGNDKPPNNALSGLSRSQRMLVGDWHPAVLMGRRGRG